MTESPVTESSGRVPKRNWIPVLLLADVGLISLSFIPGLQAGAGYLRAGTLVATLGALALAVTALPPTAVSTRRRRVGKAVALVAAFVTAALVTAGAVVATDDSVPDAFSIETAPNATVALPVSQMTYDPSEAQLEASLVQASETVDGMHNVNGRQRTRLVEAAKASDYALRSGLTLDWDAAVVQSYQGMKLVTIPLVGDALPDVSKVVFMYAAGRASVVEVSTRMLDVSTVHMEVWQDGAQVKNVDITNPNVVQDEDGIVQAFSWSVLNTCLSNAGIAWWILGAIAVTCTAVCVGTAGFGCAVCVAALAGGHTGLAAACVKKAAAA